MILFFEYYYLKACSYLGSIHISSYLSVFIPKSMNLGWVKDFLAQETQRIVQRK